MHLPHDPKPEDDPGLAIPLQLRASQQAVLDQLHNHVAFTEALILVCGPKGAGKSSVLEVFLEQASDYANLAFIPNPTNTSLESLRSKILRQLVTLDAYAADDTLLEALQRNIKPGRQHLIIAIDEAVAIPAALLNELQELTASRHLFNPEHQISVILAGDDNWAARVSKGMKIRAAHNDKEPPVLVDVQPLSPRECLWFARKLASTRQVTLSDEQINNLLKDTLGYPGNIQQKLTTFLLPRQAALTEEQTALDQPSAQPAGQQDNSRKVIILVVAAALVLLVVSIALNWPGSEPPTQPEVPDQIPADLAEPLADTSNTPPEESSVVMNFDDALNRLRYAAREREEELGQEAELADSIEQLTAPLSYLRHHPLPEMTEDVPANTSLPYDHAELLSRASDRVVLQVAALNEPARLDAFLAEFEHPQRAVYQTRRQQTIWYIVVVGDFSSVAAARAYLENEGSALQTLQAWPKSINTVQQEIAALNPNGGA